MNLHPSIPVRIKGIIRTTDDAVLIQLPSGKACWIPRAHTEFFPGHVILTPWMAAKIKTEHPNQLSEKPCLSDRKETHSLGGNHGKKI